MGSTTTKIIEMIINNASANEICKETGLSNKQLFYRLSILKLKGYDFQKEYYYNGEIVYNLNKRLNEEKTNEILLHTSDTDKLFKAVFISDLHLASINDRVDLLNQLYEFCIKEDIHIIINGGDLIDGFLGYSNTKKFNTSDEQINYALKVYPFDKNILNFICLGNHDYSTLEKSGQNLETVLLNRRHDIISLGYGVGVLNVKNDKIVVKHPKTFNTNSIGVINRGLLLTGHTHHSQNKVNGGLVNIYLPTLSDVQIENHYPTVPSFIKATISYNGQYFGTGVFEHFIFGDKVYKVTESHYELNMGRESNTQKEEEPKVLKKEQTKPSQIDKFNKRYGK